MHRAFSPRSLASFSLLLALAGCTDSGPSDDEVIADASDVGESVDASSESVEASSESAEASSESVDVDSSESVDSSEVDSSEVDSSESGVECHYPAGAVEPMALNEVITPYSWPAAIHADGSTTSLDLIHVPCDTDAVIDWSVHELLVFISLPAW